MASAKFCFFKFYFLKVFLFIKSHVSFSKIMKCSQSYQLQNILWLGKFIDSCFLDELNICY